MESGSEIQTSYNSEPTITSNTRPVFLLERFNETNPEMEHTTHYLYDNIEGYFTYEYPPFLFRQGEEIVTELPSWVWEMRSGLQQALNQGKISPSVVRRRQPILLASSLTNGQTKWIGRNTITDTEWLNQPYRPTSRLERVGRPDPDQPPRWIIRANPDDEDD
jgi:hypothetical protein